MTISINTSEYIKYKNAIVDGTEVQARAMNSAESLTMLSLQRSLQDSDEDKAEVMKKLTTLYFGLYRDPEEAQKILGDLPFDALFDIYAKIMEG